MKGRRPKPLALHALEGTFRKSRHGESLIAINPTMPPMPDHLDAQAQTEWHRITAEMYAAGTLAKIDAQTIAAYCCTVSRWMTAELELQKTGLVIRTQSNEIRANPYVKIAQDSLAMLRQFAIELGISPSARTRLKAEPVGSLPDEFDLHTANVTHDATTGKYFDMDDNGREMMLAEVMERTGNKFKKYTGLPTRKRG